MKKLLAILLCVMMIVCMMPTVAMAETADASGCTGECAHKALYNGYHYDTLSAAVAAANAAGGGTITLLGDIENENAAYELTKGIVIDGADHKITTTNAYTFRVKTAADVEIKDLTLDASGAAGSSYPVCIFSEANGGKVELSNVDVKASAAGGSGYAVYVFGDTDVIIEECNISGYAAIVAAASGAEITVNGGTLSSRNGYANTPDNNYGTIAFREDDITINLNGVAVSASSDEGCADNVTVTIDVNAPAGAEQATMKIVADANTSFTDDKVLSYIDTSVYEVKAVEGLYYVAEKQTTPVTPTPPPAGGIYIPVTNPLTEAQKEATTAVAGYVDPSDYTAEATAEIATITEQVKKDIAAAKTVEEVKAIEEAAKTEIDKIETAEEEALMAAVEDTKFKARSQMTTLNGKKAVKLTWNVPEGMELDGYEVYRSTERYKGYGTEPFWTTTKTTYTNNKDLKSGNTYYYKVRGYKIVNDEIVYSEYSYKAWRTID